MAQPNSANFDSSSLRAGVLALLVHVAFFIFLTFGLSWKTYPPEGVVVDLWSKLPQPAPKPVKKIKPVQPKSIVPPKKIEPLPPKPEKLPTLTKPDIALKKEKIKKPKPKPIAKKQKKDREQKARVAAQVKQFQKELQEEERRLKEAGAQAAVKRNLVDEYKAKILAKIKSNIIMPTELPGNPVAEFDVTLIPGGEIISIKQRTSSGFVLFDKAVERAIVKSRPLPLPPDPLLFPNFRDLSLKVHYRE